MGGARVVMVDESGVRGRAESSGLGLVVEAVVGRLVEVLGERLGAVMDARLARLEELLRAERVPGVMDVEQAAVYLGCERHKVTALCKNGHLRHSWVGERRKIRREWLDAYLEARATGESEK